MIKECPSCHSLFLAPDDRYKFCKFCRKDFAEQKRIERQKIEDVKWLKQKEKEKILFQKEIRHWDVVELNRILSAVDTPLYIIGNGFDLLHGAKSSYYDFANTLGKRSNLRWYLETYLMTDNLWGDFEGALGHLNIGMMTSSSIIDMWLNDYNAYDEEASAADFYAAAESAASPAVDMTDDLQRRFRVWVEGITISTLDRPLSGLIRNAPVLCFNYTEFVENLYGVDHDNVCYIHGCRKKIKGKPKDRLILGHIPGANDIGYEFDEKWKPKSGYKGLMIERAREVALEQISYCDDELTKHSKEIIRKHQDFFDGLKGITDVIVIGHSLSEVDWDYFNEVNRDGLNWYFSCHGLRDFANIKRFAARFSISADRIHVFRLDEIQVKIIKRDRKIKAPKERTLCRSARWNVRELNGRLSIYDGERNSYSLVLPGSIRKAILFDTHLIVIGEASYLLTCEDGNWKFVGELEAIPNQGLFNRRLDRVLYRNDELIFVYNNRIRRYSLEDARLIENKALRNARELHMQGERVKFR